MYYEKMSWEPVKGVHVELKPISYLSDFYVYTAFMNFLRLLLKPHLQVNKANESAVEFCSKRRGCHIVLTYHGLCAPNGRDVL